MLPIRDHEFWIESLQSVASFEKEGGKVTKAIFIVGDKQMTAPRIADEDERRATASARRAPSAREARASRHRRRDARLAF